MDALTSAAARALARGDALQALKQVSLREDPPALALRGIALAQLGEWARARELLRRAGQAFGPRAALARARCVVAEAEVALAMRDLAAPTPALGAAMATLEARGDRANAVQARLVLARRDLLLGRLDEASALLAPVDPAALPPLPAAVAALLAAELALRSLLLEDAGRALAQADEAAARAGVGALQAEAALLRSALAQPAARRIAGGSTTTLRLAEVAALLDSQTLVVDACRRGLRQGAWRLPLASRPVLLVLARALAEAWPADVDRATLILRAFRTRHPDETHRARLRVEIGRLRALLAGVAGIAASARGFVLQPAAGGAVAVLAPPLDGGPAEMLALLADGAAWSSSALALALGASQRSVQRELVVLQAVGQVRAVGQGRARRWLAPPLAGFTTILLLPAALALE